MNDPKQDATPLTSDIWPPPPAVASPVGQVKTSPQWFRPAFWLGIFFNVLACMPAIGLLQVPDGKEEVSLHLHDYPQTVIIFVAMLAFVIGVPFAIWQIRKRRKQGQSILWECAGLFFCLLPLFIGSWLTFAVVMAKGFHTADM